MNKSLVGIIIAVVVLGAGMFVLTKKSDNKSTTATPSTTAHPDMAAASNADSQTTSEQPAANTVTIKDSAFAPAKLTVKAGTMVTWTQADSIQHDVSPDKQSPDFVGSNLLSKGESYSFTFKKAGTYTYHCTPHPFMKGTIEVTE